MAHKIPGLTVDIILEENNKVLMIRRKGETYHNHLALPGGFVDYGEPVEISAVREAHEELGISITPHSMSILTPIGIQEDMLFL